MNKTIFLCVSFFALFLAACTGSQRSGQVASNSSGNTANSKISFGVYDISKSGPDFALNQGDLPDQTVEKANVGGGGRSEPRSLLATEPNISLTKASSSLADVVPADRKIIRNGELGIEADKPEEIQDRVGSIAQSKGGFVVASQQRSSDPRAGFRDIVEMSVRVPAEKFADTLSEIKAGPGRILGETITGEDVTEEFIDIDARLRAKKALEQQFMEIMKRANTVDDALSVQSQLADVRSEIEKIEGRRRFIENQASLSTITIRIQAPTVFAAETAGFGDRLSDSFGRGFEVALNFILGLVTFILGALPFVVFIGLPGYMLARAILRRRNRPMSFSEIAKDEIKAE